MDNEIREYERAFILLTIAAEQETEAMFYLAMMYEKGLHVERDRSTAEYCLRQIRTATDLADDVFYKAAGDVLECWEVDAPEEFIDAILHGLG